MCAFILAVVGVIGAFESIYTFSNWGCFGQSSILFLSTIDQCMVIPGQGGKGVLGPKQSTKSTWKLLYSLKIYGPIS